MEQVLAAKKTERFWLPKQLGVDSDMAFQIRGTASADRRGIREQIGYLIELGLLYRAALQTGNEHHRESVHAPAQFSTKENSASHTAALTGTEVPAGAQMSLPGTVGPIPAKRRKTA